MYYSVYFYYYDYYYLKKIIIVFVGFYSHCITCFSFKEGEWKKFLTKIYKKLFY